MALIYRYSKLNFTATKNCLSVIQNLTYKLLLRKVISPTLLTDSSINSKAASTVMSREDWLMYRTCRKQAANFVLLMTAPYSGELC